MTRSDQRADWVALDAGSKKRASRLDPYLLELGGKITALLDSGKVQRSDCMIATLDDFVGATYALILAFHNLPSFKYRPKGQRIDSRVVLKRARSIEQARRIRTTGKWMAGLHFNSALFRLAAVYHRSLKIAIGRPMTRQMIGDDKHSNSLISRAKNKYKAWTGRTWSDVSIRKVHREVNGLKHTSAGIYWGRDVNETEAILAAKELLELLEAWNAQP